MKQASFDLTLSLSVKKSGKLDFLGQKDKVVPWQPLIDLSASYYPDGKKGRPLIAGNHGAHALFAAVVHPVGPRHGGVVF
jgi:hypothetical protein